MMQKVLMLALGCIVLGGSAAAQTESEAPLLVPRASFGISEDSPSSKFRLIDPSRLKNYNQVVFSYNSSARGSVDGLFLSSFDYRLANPLDVSVTLGASLTPQSEWSAGSQGQFFLSSLSLRYQPSESTLIQFHYQDPRGIVPYYYANPLANRWWYRER